MWACYRHFLTIASMAVMLTLFSSDAGSALVAEERAIPPAYGPYAHLTPEDLARAKTFHSTDRLVMTYYFYWYDSAANQHIV